MARPLRLELAGAVYHVTARGNDRGLIFRDDLDRGMYLERLAHYRQRFGFRVLAFCLMPNHTLWRSGRDALPCRASWRDSSLPTRSGSTGGIGGRVTFFRGATRRFSCRKTLTCWPSSDIST